MTKKVPKRWEQAIAGLLAEKTVEAAAEKAGVPYRTLKSWLALPAFADLYRAARCAVLERTLSRLLALNGKALDALEKNLSCDNPAAVNKAVELTLSHTQKGVETLDHAVRIANLEELLKAKGGNP
jgi:hypothetical protein